jgi:hypothetical protein
VKIDELGKRDIFLKERIFSKPVDEPGYQKRIHLNGFRMGVKAKPGKG